jgi:hypothetical protein
MSAFLKNHFYKLCLYLSFFKPSEPAVYDETLASSIKQSTQQRAKGRTKREDPSASHQKQNPNRVTKEAKEQSMFQSNQVSIITIKTCCLLFVAHQVLIANFNINTQTHIYFT